LPEWRAAMTALLLEAEHSQPCADPMLARIGMMQALNEDKLEAPRAPRRKRAKAYKVVG
jgi:hypothetical protein